MVKLNGLSKRGLWNLTTYLVVIEDFFIEKMPVAKLTSSFCYQTGDIKREWRSILIFEFVLQLLHKLDHFSYKHYLFAEM